VLTSGAFLVLAICLSAGGFAGVATVVQLVPALGELGVGAATASVLLGLVGVGQVLGRLAFGPFARRVGTVGQTLGVLAVGAVVPLLILLPGGLAVGVVLCLLLGLVRGSFTMVSATAVAERWGIRNYGAINGVLTTPVDLARAGHRGAARPWRPDWAATGCCSSRSRCWPGWPPPGPWRPGRRVALRPPSGWIFPGGDEALVDGVFSRRLGVARAWTYRTSCRVEFGQ
jgi:hypothetical protein